MRKDENMFHLVHAPHIVGNQGALRAGLHPTTDKVDEFFGAAAGVAPEPLLQREVAVPQESAADGQLRDCG